MSFDIANLLPLAGAGVGAFFGNPMMGASVGGMLAGLFGSSPAQIDTSNLTNMAYRFRREAGQFLDPNSKFYTNATARQKAMLADINAAAVNKMRNQLASQGINSNAITGSLMNEAEIKAGEAANNFSSNLYTRGAGIGASLLGQAGAMERAIANARAGQANLDSSFQSSMINTGIGLFQDYLMGQRFDKFMDKYFDTVKPSAPSVPNVTPWMPSTGINWMPNLGTGFNPIYRNPWNLGG